MARLDILHQIEMKKNKSKAEFNFDMLRGPRLLELFSPYDIQLLDDISKDPKLITKLEERIKYNDQILSSRGFVRMTQGTNRAVYKYLENQGIVAKVAISVKGREDSPKEFHNQYKVKPFIAKCFDVNPTGVIGIFERVEDIRNKQQFIQIASNVFDLLNKIMESGYIIADSGSNFFRNYGIRLGFGPVLIDYPLLFEVDPKKIFCNAPTPSGIPCGGAIDFDVGFNFLYCEKCGIQYSASQLEKDKEEGNIKFYSSRKEIKMKLTVQEVNTNGEVVNSEDTLFNVSSSETYLNNRMREHRRKGKHPQVEKFLMRDEENDKEEEIVPDSVEVEEAEENVEEEVEEDIEETDEEKLQDNEEEKSDPITDFLQRFDNIIEFSQRIKDGFQNGAYETWIDLLKNQIDGIDEAYKILWQDATQIEENIDISSDEDIQSPEELASTKSKDFSNF